ncbi:DUF4352 domain-containing protein [Streptomyces bullii]|uniref:DUF4352 domain-containing protein n=1 Tax=Streptomyces bullii TaxID=349910 RepID=A0ABW0V4G9_9ACTN
MRTRTAIATVILFTGLAVGCSGGSDDPTVAKATDTPPASPTPSPTPSPSQETYKLGDTVDVSTADGKFTAAALAYKDRGIPDVAELLQADQKWAALEVKVCNKDAEGFGVSPFVWSLAYADGARVEATHMTGNELPRPLYPLDAKVKAGDCVRGNVLFQVPKAGRPERVLYSPDVLDEPVEWTAAK